MKKIGILGGGQLALMMLPALEKLGLKSVVLDKTGNSCEGLADEYIIGDFQNPNDILKLAHCDFVTFEIESISQPGLLELSQKTKVHPSPFVLEIAQDKGKQKSFFQENNIPTSSFLVKSLTNKDDLTNKVVKLCRGGYDGQGVWVAKKDTHPPDIFLNQECVIEEKVELVKELAQVCTRSLDGEIQFYELVEMVMDPELNLLDYQMNPANVSDELYEKAKLYTQKIVEGLNHVGTLAVEFFLTPDNELVVNEIAPRVHNSGHNTIESAPTSQFENHILAISEQKLGDTLPAKAALTMNIIGEGEAGEAFISNEINDEEVFVHLYNKHQSRPGRKMGHLTILGDAKKLKEKAKTIKKQIRVTGRKL